jgi:hypothetical protein
MSNSPKSESEVAFKIGELTGTINTFREDLYGKLDEMSTNINGKIGRDTCENIVGKAIRDHKLADHKTTDRKKSCTSKDHGIRIDGAILKRIAIILGSGGGGVGVWALIEKLLG